MKLPSLPKRPHPVIWTLTDSDPDPFNLKEVNRHV